MTGMNPDSKPWLKRKFLFLDLNFVKSVSSGRISSPTISLSLLRSPCKCYLFHHIYITVCPRSFDFVQIVIYKIKWVKNESKDTFRMLVYISSQAIILPISPQSSSWVRNPKLATILSKTTDSFLLTLGWMCCLLCIFSLRKDLLKL